MDTDRYVDWRRSDSLELLSQLTEIWFLLSCKQTLQANSINIILDKAPNVRTFGIRNNGSLRGDIEKECAAISRQIDYFTIRSTDFTAMKLILAHVEHFTTITFTIDWSSSTNWTKIIEYLEGKGKKFVVTDRYRTIQIWLKNDE